MRIGNDTAFTFSLATGAASASAARGNEATGATASDAQGLALNSASNMLESNFVHSGIERSRYVTGLIDSFRIESEFRNKMQGIFTMYADLAAQADSYADRALVGQQAANAVQDLKDEEVSEKMGEKLEESRKEMEERIEEKVQGGETGTEAGAETVDAAQDTEGDEHAATVVDAVESPEKIGDIVESQAESDVAASQTLAEPEAALVVDPASVTPIDIIV